MATVQENWLYFKQDPDDKWLLKYCRCQSPFLFIYQNEELKRKGKPDMVLIINDKMTIKKQNDRISYCGWVKLKKKLKYTREHWSVVTRDGYIIIGKIYHILSDGSKSDDAIYPNSSSYSNLSYKNKINIKKSGKKRKNRAKSRTFSMGTDDDNKNTSNILNNIKKRRGFSVMAIKEYDEVDTTYKWDVNNIKIIHSGSPEVIIENKLNKTKLAQLRFKSKEEAQQFYGWVKMSCSNVNDNRIRTNALHPDVFGIGKPLFPLMISDKQYNKQYFFISLNNKGIDMWHDILKPKPIDPLIRPLISRLECIDSSLVNLDEVDEIYDLISRDLNKSNRNNDIAMQNIINLPMEKRILILHMNAISSSFQGVHYWISILENPKEPAHVLKLFQKHLDNQTVKKAKFIESFVENQGIASLLSIYKNINKDMMMSDGEKTFFKLRILLAKVFEIIISAPPFNETMREDDATDEQKYQAKKRKPAAAATARAGTINKQSSNNNNNNISKVDSSKKSSNTHQNAIAIVNDDDDDDGFDEEEMRRLYGDSDEDTSSDDDVDVDDINLKIDQIYNDDDNINKHVTNNNNNEPIEIGVKDANTPKSPNTSHSPNVIQKAMTLTSGLPKTATKLFSTGSQAKITHSTQNKLSKALTIRYQSGAEVLYECEQNEDIIEYLIGSIWGFHECEVLKDDLAPGIGAIKCLTLLCLLKPEFGISITTILLDTTDLGKEYDNWWMPITTTIQNVLEMYKTSNTIFKGNGNMFIIQDQCRNYIFGLITLVLTMIDCFDIDDRIIERRMLDSINFKELLNKLQLSISQQSLHSLIELYKQSESQDIAEVAYSQMEITEEFLNYLRDKTIETGFHEYFSNILTNLAAFPDDAEEAWTNVDQYVYHWKSKYVDDPDASSDDDDKSISSYDPNADADDNKNTKTDNNNNNNNNVALSDKTIDDFQASDQKFLSLQQVDQLDKTNTLTSITENLKADKIELNTKYQSQLQQNNELKDLIKDYRDKVAIFEKQIDDLKKITNKKQSKDDHKTDGGDGVGGGEGDGTDIGDKLTDAEKKKKEKELNKFKLEQEMKKQKAAIQPRKKQDDDKKNDDDDKKAPIPTPLKPAALPPLNDSDQKLVSKYQKQLKMGLPPPAIKHKMKKEKNDRLIPYVFPDEAAKLLSISPPALPLLNDVDQKLVNKYKKQLKMGLPPPAIKHKMKKEQNGRLIPYVFGVEMKQQSSLPSDVFEKPKIKPNVQMLPFHWNKIKEKIMKSTIWYDIYHKYGKNIQNQIFDITELDKLFGKPKDNKKKKKKSKKNKKNRNGGNAVPSEVTILDKKTRQKVEIFLNRVRMNWSMSTMKICDHITNMNERGLSHDHVEKLMKIAPNDRESVNFRESISNLSPSDMLGKAALFWQELLNVDTYIRDRLLLWEFKLSFKSLIAEEFTKTSMLNDCISQIRNNIKFQRVLSLALDIGNYVNGGKRQGRAYGFNIGTLEKLDQFPRRRNPDGSPVPTMLEYIYKLLNKIEPDILTWCDDFEILNKCITIDLSFINSNLKKFEEKIDLLYDRLQSSDETQFSGKQFVHKMKPFYDSSCKEITSLSDSVQKLNKELKELSLWFDCDDADNIEFLKQINNFRKTFKSIGPRLIKRDKDKERKAKRKAKLEQMKKTKKGKKSNKKNKKQAKFIDTSQHEFVSKGTKSPPPIAGGIQMPGFDRRGTILRAVANKKALNVNSAGDIVRQLSGSIKGRGPSASISISRGGLRNDLWKFAASIDAKIKI